MPFGLDDLGMRRHAYWQTIFPNSKRLMTSGRLWFGDNMDVRPPATDELWGPCCSLSCKSNMDGLGAMKLTLDGVFFVDGGFVGPNRLGTWEHTVSASEAHLACATLAREARHKGAPLAEFFVQARTLTGQTKEGRLAPPPPPIPLESKPPDPETIRKDEYQWVGWKVLRLRETLGDDEAITHIEAWSDAPVPKFHKLS